MQGRRLLACPAIRRLNAAGMMKQRRASARQDTSRFCGVSPAAGPRRNFDGTLEAPCGSNSEMDPGVRRDDGVRFHLGCVVRISTCKEKAHLAVGLFADAAEQAYSFSPPSFQVTCR